MACPQFHVRTRDYGPQTDATLRLAGNPTRSAILHDEHGARMRVAGRARRRGDGAWAPLPEGPRRLSVDAPDVPAAPSTQRRRPHKNLLGRRSRETQTAVRLLQARC